MKNNILIYTNTQVSKAVNQDPFMFSEKGKRNRGKSKCSHYNLLCTVKIKKNRFHKDI